MGLKSGFGHFFGKKQLPYLENCKTISHIMIVMTVNSTFYYITGGKGSASFVCEIGLNIESCWKYYRKRVFFLYCDRIRSQPWSLNMEEIQVFLARAYNYKAVWSQK